MRFLFASLAAAFCVVSLAAPFGAASAQEMAADTVTVMKARVMEVLDERQQIIPGTDTTHIYQDLRVFLLDGPQAGLVVDVPNDYLELEMGDTFFLSQTTSALDGTEYWSVMERYRAPMLGALAALFVLLTILFGGKQGFRGLIALALSFGFIVLLLFPGIIAGYSPIAISVGVASLIIIVGSYVTHGVSRMTTSAVIGMIITIGITGALAYAALAFGDLTGFGSDESIYLNFNTRGSIDFAGLLLGAILIGLLGVLYDAAIGQSVSVEELRTMSPAAGKQEVFWRAIRIGREHVGALVNTLAIAYTGAALPLLLFVYQSNANLELVFNGEIIAAELVRIFVGSIGVVLAVPITTVVATFMLVHRSQAAESAADTVGVRYEEN